jgi:TPP-dependent 2-oxoacid decarboxylase
MLSGRPGPVNLDMPLNVVVEEAEMEPPRTVTPTFNGAPGDPQALTTALEMLLTAERPVIIAGQGVLLAEAAPKLQKFAERTGIPVVTSPNPSYDQKDINTEYCSVDMPPGAQDSDGQQQGSVGGRATPNSTGQWVEP